MPYFKKAIVIGAAGTGKEAAEWISKNYSFVGYLDDFKTGPSILGNIADANIYQDTHVFLNALGSYKNMMSRKRLVEDFQHLTFAGFNYSACTYSTADISPFAIVFPGSIISAFTKIGEHALIYHNAVVSHDSTIDDFSILSNGAVLSGNVKVGKNCYIGANSFIKEGLSIGSNSTIAAGASVITDVPPNSIYIDNNRILENTYI